MLQRNMEDIMARETKKPSAVEEQSSSFASLLFGWTQQGVESVLASQRILADLVTRKSASAMSSLREGLSDSKNSPAAVLSELAVEGTANLIEAQKVLLNLVEQESGIVMEGVQERVGGSALAVAMASRLRDGIDTLVQMQQQFLTVANKHMQQRLAGVKAGEMPDPACMVEAAREAMDNFVRTQKKLLDIIVEDAGKAKGRQDGKKTAVSGLAREAAGSFIEAQKNLLDLAGQQVNVNLKAASHAAEMLNMVRINPLPAFTGDSVKSFVEAEKKVLDSIMTPGQKPASKAAKRPGPRRRRAAAQAAGA